MADAGSRAAPTPGSWRADLRAYRVVLGSRIASQRVYGLSFGMDVFAAVLVTLAEFIEIWVLFHNVHALGGLDLAAVMLVFGLAEMSFAIADMVAGHSDGLAELVRTGKVDVFYLRPQPVLAQLLASDLQLRRLARAAAGAVVLVVGTVLAGVDWTPDRIALLLVAVPSGIAIYAALFVAAAGLQFILVNGSEATNAFVYGGRFAAGQPASVWPRSLVAVFGLLFPVIFTGYLPALWLTGAEGTALLRPWLAWCAPLAAFSAWAVALAAWRLGMRHYQGAGG